MSVEKVMPISHVVDVLGNVTGRDQPILRVEKAIEMVAELGKENLLSDVVFFDPFCKAGEILLACAFARCRAASSNGEKIMDVNAIYKELFDSDRYFALAPDVRHYRLSLRTFLGNVNSHEDKYRHVFRNGNYMSEEDGRLNEEIFKVEFENMIEYIIQRSKGRKIIAVGNPPYQENYKNSTSNTGANPIYHIFLNTIIESGKIDEFMMVIPSRWFAGGRGKSLKLFAEKLRNSEQVRTIYDFENSREIFPTVDIKGGVCFLHWEAKYKGKTKFYSNSEKKGESIDLSEGDIIVRNKVSRAIVRKIKEKAKKYISDIAWSWNPFNLSSNYFERNNECTGDGLLECFTKRHIIKKIAKSKITKNVNKINEYKVACPKAVKGGGIPFDPEQIFVLGKKQVCTETYMVIDSFSTEMEAKKFQRFLQTDFVRFLVSVKKITQDVTKDTWSLVPCMVENEHRKSQDLYKYFKLSNDEIEFIKGKIEEWK